MTADRRALAVLLAGACIIGVGPVLVRLSQAGPASAAFWRMAFALPLLAVLTLRARDRDAAARIPAAALLAGVLFAADLACWHYGIRFTSVANATVLSNLTPILVTAAAWIAYGQKPSRLFLAAMVLAMGGAATMALARNGGVVLGRDGRDPHLGDALSALTSLWYAGYFLSVQKARATLPAGRVMLVSSAVAAPLLLVAALGFGESIFPAAAAGWAACVGLGVMHVGGQGAIAWALGRLPAALITVVVLVQPVVAGLLGWLVFGEALSPLQGLGAAVALAGVALAQASSAAKGNGRRPFDRRPPDPMKGEAA